MEHGVWKNTIAVLLLWNCTAMGQAPLPQLPTPPSLPVANNTDASPREGDLLTFRTSGQPERQVKIVKLCGAGDPDGLVDVLDTGTGARYSIPAKIFAAMVRTASISRPPVPAPVPPPTLPNYGQTLPPLNLLPTTDRDLSKYPTPRPVPANENGWPKNTSTAALTSAQRFPSTTQFPSTKKGNANTPPQRTADLRSPTPTVENVRTLMQDRTPPPPVIVNRSKPVETAFTWSPPKLPAPSLPPAPVLPSSMTPPVPVLPPFSPTPTPSLPTTVRWEPVAPVPVQPAIAQIASFNPVPEPKIVPVAVLPTAVEPVPVIPTFVVPELPASTPTERVSLFPKITVPIAVLPTVPEITSVTTLATTSVLPKVAVPMVAVPIVSEKPIPAPVLATNSLALPPTQPNTSTVVLPNIVIKPPEYVPVPLSDIELESKPVTQQTVTQQTVTQQIVTQPVVPPALTRSPTPVATAIPTSAPVTPTLAPPAQFPTIAELPTIAQLPASVTMAKPVVQVETVSATSTVESLLLPLPNVMADEIQPFVHNLFTAMRPSIRERGATALAECRFGSKPEVKAIIARAALLDPAPNVRATCIKLLSTLGYHETTYLDFLDACCSDSGHPQVKQAAIDALAKLTSRN